MRFFCRSFVTSTLGSVSQMCSRSLMPRVFLRALKLVHPWKAQQQLHIWETDSRVEVTKLLQKKRLQREAHRWLKLVSIISCACDTPAFISCTKGLGHENNTTMTW